MQGKNFGTLRFTTILVALVAVGIFLALVFSRQLGICESASDCSFNADRIATILSPVIPLFIFALITYFMREEVFKAWVKFAIPAVVIAIILTLLTPESTGGGFGPSISIGKGDTALLTSVLFVLISIIIIVYKYLRSRRASVVGPMQG